MVINLFTVLYYNPTLDQDCPPWVYASCALGLFLYQTFDAVDGMQAYVFSSPFARFSRTEVSVLGGERDKVVLWVNCLITASMLATPHWVS